jgi:hypothetical protein
MIARIICVASAVFLLVGLPARAQGRSPAVERDRPQIERERAPDRRPAVERPTPATRAETGRSPAAERPTPVEKPEVVDKAPSGKETSKAFVGDKGVVQAPGHDTETIDVRTPGRQILKVDPNATDVPGNRPDDVTIIDQRKR